MFFSVQLIGQHKIGVRAGQNYSWLTGELEESESYGLSLGFHFGVNYTYQLTPNLGLRAELLYTQRGTKYKYIDDGAYLLMNPLDIDITPFFAYGDTDLDLDISTGYLSVPITIQYDLTSKFEVFGGISLDILLGPTGRGTIEFFEESDEFSFLQTYEHNYRKDEAGELHDFIILSPGANLVTIDLNGEKENFYGIETAYQNLTASQLENGKKYKLFDSHVILGFNYFINSGFYAGIRAEYGLFDMTNSNVDFSRNELSATGGYIMREDTDKSRSLSLSIGFRF